YSLYRTPEKIAVIARDRKGRSFGFSISFATFEVKEVSAECCSETTPAAKGWNQAAGFFADLFAPPFLEAMLFSMILFASAAAPDLEAARRASHCLRILS